MYGMPDIPEPNENEWHIAFRASLDWSAWIKETFCDPESEMFNEDHHHLAEADIGVLFAFMSNQKKGKRVIGRAQMGEVRGNDEWARALSAEQRYRWFGMIPDFIMTLDATWMDSASNLERCALIEHELFHMAHAVDRFKMPMFQASGKPKWAIAPHDIEEFAGVVRRYGTYSDELKELIHAASQPSEFDAVQIDGLCGTCKRNVA